MKKKSVKLNKDYILSYFLQHLLIYLKNTEGYKPSKSQSEILEDISKVNVLLERYTTSEKFPDELKYLEKLNEMNEKRFIYPRSVESTTSNAHMNYNVFYSIKTKEVLSILEFNKLINDSNKLGMLRLIQNFLDVNLNFHPIICRFYKKNLIEQRKMQMYTPMPNPENSNDSLLGNFKVTSKINSFGNSNPYREEDKPSNFITLSGLNAQNFKPPEKKNKSNSENKELGFDDIETVPKNKKYAALNSHLLSDLNNMTLLHNTTLSELMERTCLDMIKLLETYHSAILMDSLFRFVRTNDNRYYFFSCERVILKLNIGVSPYSINFNGEEKMNKTGNFSMKNNNNINNMNKGKDNRVRHITPNTVRNKAEGERTSSVRPLFGRSKVYEKLGSTVCDGEFCEFTIPKHFKNLKANKDKSSAMAGLSGYNNYSSLPSNNSGSTQDTQKKKNKYKIPEFKNKISLYLIKKIYDNPVLVNIVLKSYKIFPKNIDSLLVKLKEDFIKKELQKKEKMDMILAKNSRMGNYNAKVGDALETFSSIGTTNTQLSSNNNINANGNSNIKNNHGHNSNIPYSNTSRLPHISNSNTFGKEGSISNSIERAREIEKHQELALYVPTKDKFRHINSDKIYSDAKVCDNCYMIYLLIDGFVNNINPKQSNFTNIEKAKHTLLNGDKLVGADELDNPNMHYLYKQDDSNFDLRKILKKQIKKEKKDHNQSKTRNRVEPSEQTKDLFNYRMNVNLKVMNFNLVAENKQNKFFKIIFDQINSNMDELNRHLNVKSYPSVFSKSMTSLRMHMGINSSSGNTVGSYANNYMGIFNRKNKFDDKYGMLVVDRDLFLLFKAYTKQKAAVLSGTSSFVGKKDWTKKLTKALSMRSYKDKNLEKLESLTEGFPQMKLKEILINNKDRREITDEAPRGSKNFDVIIDEGEAEDREDMSIRKKKKREGSGELSEGDEYLKNDFEGINNDDSISSKEQNDERSGKKHEEEIEREGMGTNKGSNRASMVKEYKKDGSETNQKEEIYVKTEETEMDKAEHKGDTENIYLENPNTSSQENKNNKQLVLKINPNQSYNAQTQGTLTKRRLNDEEEQLPSQQTQESKEQSKSIQADTFNDNYRERTNTNNSKSSESIDFPTKLKDKIKQVNSRASRVSVTGKQYKHSLNFQDLLTDKEQNQLNIKLANSEVKKISVQSIFYYEWTSDLVKNTVPFYYTTSPLTIFNEVNLPVYDNPLKKTQEMKIEDFYRICFGNVLNNYTSTVGQPTINSFNSGKVQENNNNYNTNTNTNTASRSSKNLPMKSNVRLNSILGTNKELRTIDGASSHNPNLHSPSGFFNSNQKSNGSQLLGNRHNSNFSFNNGVNNNIGGSNLNSNQASANTVPMEALPHTLLGCKVFVYDQNTAVPFKVEEIYNKRDDSNNQSNSHKERTEKRSGNGNGKGNSNKNIHSNSNSNHNSNHISNNNSNNNSYNNSNLEEIREKHDHSGENISDENNSQEEKDFFKKTDQGRDSEDPHAVKLILLTINDFFDSFTRVNDNLKDSVRKSVRHYLATHFGSKDKEDEQDTSEEKKTEEDIDFSENSQIEIIKHVKFNLPGQPYTVFRKSEGQFVMNNFFYSDFLDRFLYFLNEEKVFDSSYRLIIVGIGNGGQIALTFASLYEKYWSMMLSIILFNSYLENDDFLNKSMIEILKIIESSVDPKIVDFFIRSITVNPGKLLQKEEDIHKLYANDNLSTFNNGSPFNMNNMNSNNNSSNMNNLTNNNNTGSQHSHLNHSMLEICSMPGFFSITKGYFYNLKINLNEIITPIFCVHSNQNCFITINNLNKYFSYLQAQSFIPNSLNSEDNMVMDTNRKSCEFTELLSEEGVTSTMKKKLLIIDGSHDVFSEDEMYFDHIIEYFFDFMFGNYKEILSNNSHI
eukprot:CAMPEP_0170538380 /NCGR_PEP_ID=MMETSP0209-20121228/103274_1 /TAXON_ID=665100 ORGANISM="Litonotus pictus, Strain P1" /NCGR_SAMPLE_ID=MMETSP0209 /ASSEMBLY_ACC=CAM_ASM_000301 /LENGTH=1901 /DNA_ID=CAMNT_0010840059 /DNA_START=182 /DNA_END=5887 /DNA_ORIENTATION=-